MQTNLYFIPESIYHLIIHLYIVLLRYTPVCFGWRGNFRTMSNHSQIKYIWIFELQYNNNLNKKIILTYHIFKADQKE